MRICNFGELRIRKWYLYLEDTLANESGVLADGQPVRKGVIAAALYDHFADQFGEDLQETVQASTALGKEFGDCLLGPWETRKLPATARHA